MNSHPGDKDKGPPADNLGGIKNGYVFDKTSGLYVQDTKHYEGQSEHQGARKTEGSPLEVNVRTDWIQVSVSLIGLCLISFTVMYTKSQWEESQKSALASIRAAEAAENSVAEARMSREHSSRQVQQAREMSDIQSREAARASERQNIATLNASRDSLRTDQRAWLGAIDFRLANEPTIGNDVTVTFALRNTGKTPAIGVTVKFAMSIQSTEIIIPDWSMVAAKASAIVFPDAVIRDVTYKIEAAKISAADLAAYSFMRINPNMIYIRVRIDYDDVFGRHHWTQTCGKHPPYTPLVTFDQCFLGIGVDLP